MTREFPLPCTVRSHEELSSLWCGIYSRLKTCIYARSYPSFSKSYCTSLGGGILSTGLCSLTVAATELSRYGSLEFSREWGF